MTFSCLFLPHSETYPRSLISHSLLFSECTSVSLTTVHTPGMLVTWTWKRRKSVLLQPRGGTSRQISGYGKLLPSFTRTLDSRLCYCQQLTVANTTPLTVDVFGDLTGGGGQQKRSCCQDQTVSLPFSPRFSCCCAWDQHRQLKEKEQKISFLFESLGDEVLSNLKGRVCICYENSRTFLPIRI